MAGTPNRRGRGHRRRTDRIGRVDRAVGRLQGPDAASAPGRRVPGAGHVGVVWLQPDAVDAAGLSGEADPVLGRTGPKAAPKRSGAGRRWRGWRTGGPAAGGRLEAELGYGMPVGGRLVGMPSFGIGPPGTGATTGLGYGLTVAQGGAMHFELGIDANRRESPSQGTAEHGVLGRLTRAMVDGGSRLLPAVLVASSGIPWEQP